MTRKHNFSLRCKRTAKDGKGKGGGDNWKGRWREGNSSMRAVSGLRIVHWPGGGAAPLLVKTFNRPRVVILWASVKHPHVVFEYFPQYTKIFDATKV